MELTLPNENQIHVSGEFKIAKYAIIKKVWRVRILAAEDFPLPYLIRTTQGLRNIEYILVEVGATSKANPRLSTGSKYLMDNSQFNSWPG